MSAPTLGRNHSGVTSADERSYLLECWSPTSTHILVSLDWNPQVFTGLSAPFNSPYDYNIYWFICTLMIISRCFYMKPLVTFLLQFSLPKTCLSRLSLTGMKPFKCNICDASFTTNGSLNRHMIIHNKSFKCSMCDESFRTSLLCKKHTKKEHAVEEESKDTDACGWYWAIKRLLYFLSLADD